LPPTKKIVLEVGQLGGGKSVEVLHDPHSQATRVPCKTSSRTESNNGVFGPRLVAHPGQIGTVISSGWW